MMLPKYARNFLSKAQKNLTYPDTGLGVNTELQLYEYEVEYLK